MPSPFPGMDPFIEGQLWGDFHTTFLTVVREQLAPRVLPHFVVHVEQYVWLVSDDEEVRRIVGPDAYVSERESALAVAAVAERGDSATAVALRPVGNRIPMPDRLEQHYLTVRDKRWQRVVTMIELLSPWNKSRGDGQRQYLNKRLNLLDSAVNLVELHLLRGGARLPTEEPLQSGDYFAFVTRPMDRPGVEVYGWSLRDALPEVPVPQSGDLPDVRLDLGSAFATTYDRGVYAASLDYNADIEPPLRDADREWLRSILSTISETRR